MSDRAGRGYEAMPTRYLENEARARALEEAAGLPEWNLSALHYTFKADFGPAETDMNEIIFLVERAPEGGYTARALGESIFAESDDLEDLHTQIRDAVTCHFDEGRAPRVIRLHFTHEEVLAT